MKIRDYLLGASPFHQKSKKKCKWKRRVLNLFFLLISVFVINLLIKRTSGYFLFACMISFLCIACPVIILFSSQSIIEEKNKIDIQRSHKLPIVFDQNKVIRGYFGTLFLFWVLPAAIFLLPDKTWILIGPPIWLFSLAVIKLTEHTWIAFGWKKSFYWCSQGVIILFLLTISIVIKIIWE